MENYGGEGEKGQETTVQYFKKVNFKVKSCSAINM